MPSARLVVWLLRASGAGHAALGSPQPEFRSGQASRHPTQASSTLLSVWLAQVLWDLVGQVPEHSLYGTHDFRRGHAKVLGHILVCDVAASSDCVPFQDLQQSGAPLAKICQAGPWRSGAMFRYLDECDLEDTVALEAAIHEEDEEWID